jgi:hypothetical protein
VTWEEEEDGEEGMRRKYYGEVRKARPGKESG